MREPSRQRTTTLHAAVPAAALLLVVSACALLALVRDTNPATNVVLALVLLCWTGREALLACEQKVPSDSEDPSPVNIASLSRSISRGESWRFAEDSLRVYHSLAQESESTELGNILSMRLPVIGATPANLSAQHRAHTLAHRFHEKADFVNVGVQALLIECDKELNSILRSPRPGRQTLLPRFKHIDVAIDELLTIQDMVSANQAAQLQAALIAPQQQLKLKLAQLKVLPDDAPFMLRLKAALESRSMQGTCNPRTMIEHLSAANDELYGIVGQLTIALHDAMEHSPGYEPFTDHELHSEDLEAEPPTAAGDRNISSPATDALTLI